MTLKSESERAIPESHGQCQNPIREAKIHHRYVGDGNCKLHSNGGIKQGGSIQEVDINSIDATASAFQIGRGTLLWPEGKPMATWPGFEPSARIWPGLRPRSPDFSIQPNCKQDLYRVEKDLEHWAVSNQRSIIANQAKNLTDERTERRETATGETESHTVIPRADPTAECGHFGCKYGHLCALRPSLRTLLATVYVDTIKKPRTVSKACRHDRYSLNTAMIH